MSGFVYYITTAEAKRVKIGFTRNHPSQRLRELQTGSPLELCIIACEPGTERDERNLHNRFSNDRVHGEWFNLTPEIKQHLRDVNKAEIVLAEAQGRMPYRWARIFRAFEAGLSAEEADAA